MSTVLVFVAAGAATWLLRVAFIALAPAGQPPAAVTRMLRYAAPAALASLIATGVDNTVITTGLAAWKVLVATAVSGLVSWRTRNVALTLLAGAASVTLLAAL